MKIKEGILIPSEVEDLIIAALDDIFAGEMTSQGAQLYQLKSVLVILSNGTLVVDEGVVYKIDKQLSPGIIKKTLQAGCVPVHYEERQKLSDGSFGPKATQLQVYLSVKLADKDNQSHVDGKSWLDLANEASMTQDENNIYFRWLPVVHDDVTILRENPVP